MKIRLLELEQTAMMQENSITKLYSHRSTVESPETKHLAGVVQR